MEFNSSFVWFDSSTIKRSLSFKEALWSFDIALGVAVQFTILDFGWFSGGEMVFGFLLDVRVATLVESSSCEEVSESDSTLFSSVVH